MAETYKKLGHELVTGGTTATMYTVPASTSAIVKHIRLTNVDTGNACHVKIYHRDNGESADTGSQILPQISIRAGGWAEFEGTIIMEALDLLSITVQTADDINYVVYGMELT
jgi:hypothetical protein